MAGGRRPAFVPTWRLRPVMWSERGGVAHVVRSARLAPCDVVQRLACGGHTTSWKLSIMPWIAARQTYRRMCTRCVRRLEAAGADGPLEPGPPD